MSTHALTASLLVPLPPLVAKCIRHLSSPPMLAVPDLFASGSVDLHHVGGALLRAEFDAVESDASGVVLDDVNHVACALLLHFADLSHPLATTTLHDCFVDAASVTEHKERLACWVAVVRLLPPSHFTLLRALTAYLREYCTRGAGSIDDCVDAFAPFLLWSRDENMVAALRPPPALDVNDAESVVVVIVQSALQTAQLVLLSHLWTIQEATNHVVASMPRCDASLRWRLERHDGAPLDPDELVGVLDFSALDTLYIETDDEMIEPDYVAVSRALLRALVLECDGMLNVPTSSASSTPRTSTDQYGYVPRSSGEAAASVSAFEAEFDAILDKVALDLDDDDAPATQAAARPPSGGQYGWIGSMRETPSPTAAAPKMSAEARQVRRKLRQTVTRSRTVLKAEHLINAPVQRRSRDLALRAAPAHYLRAPPKQNAAIDSSGPPPVRPRGPPPKKPAMAPARKKRVKAASPLATVALAAAAPPPVEQAPPPIARPTPLSRSPAAPTPQRAPLPPVSTAPVPAPVPRPASLGSHAAAPARGPVRQGQRVAAATTVSVVSPLGAPTVASAAVPPRPVNRPGGAKPLPAPPSTTNAAKPHRPTAPPPRTGYATMGVPSVSFRAATSVSAREQPTYSNLPASAATVDDGYSNLPAHTLRIQRENMGLASDDEGLEIEVFDDSLLSQLQQ